MKIEQVWDLFRQVIKEHGSRLTQKSKWKSQLSVFHNLTPGDFATVIRQNRLFDDKLEAVNLFEGLKNEANFKKGRNKLSIGFSAKL